MKRLNQELKDCLRGIFLNCFRIRSAEDAALFPYGWHIVCREDCLDMTSQNHKISFKYNYTLELNKYAQHRVILVDYEGPFRLEEIPTSVSNNRHQLVATTISSGTSVSNNRHFVCTDHALELCAPSEAQKLKPPIYIYERRYDYDREKGFPDAEPWIGLVRIGEILKTMRSAYRIQNKLQPNISRAYPAYIMTRLNQELKDCLRGIFLNCFRIRSAEDATLFPYRWTIVCQDDGLDMTSQNHKISFKYNYTLEFNKYAQHRVILVDYEGPFRLEEIPLS
jgi:hypothetical protein